jgi:hypothetical protein
VEIAVARVVVEAILEDVDLAPVLVVGEILSRRPRASG